MRGTVYADVGASNVRVGLDASAPLLVYSAPSTSDELVELLAVAAMEVAPAANGGAVLVAVPGVIDASGQIVKSLYTGLEGCHLAQDLANRLASPVRVVNDARAQAVGSARESETVVYLSLGTAVGGCIVRGGEVLIDESGFGGELGHVPVPGSRLSCVCGGVGCLDASAGGQGLERLLGPAWWTADKSKVTRATEVITSAGAAVGEALGYLERVVGCDRAVVAGHLVGHDEFTTAVVDMYRQFAWRSTAVSFYCDTWPLVVRGLTKYAHSCSELEGS